MGWANPISAEELQITPTASAITDASIRFFDPLSAAVVRSKPRQHVPLVDLKAQLRTIRPEVDAAIGEVLDNCVFALGKAVDRFESAFAESGEAKHAVGVDSGISGLELALRGWGIGPGDEVITAANSFIASASAISFTGATPVFADVDPDTLRPGYSATCRVCPIIRPVVIWPMEDAGAATWSGPEAVSASPPPLT